MIKLTKTQRDNLIGIAMGTVMLLGVLWWYGVKTMDRRLAATRAATVETKKKLHDAEALMRRGEDFAEMLKNRSDLLAKHEAGLAPDRDAYAWLISLMTGFLQGRKGVSIDSYSQPEYHDEGMIPKFPYHWATFHLRASGYYHDFGLFFRDFENTYPYFRIQNPVLSANTGPGMEPEKLSVTFDLVAPVTSSDTK